jgi:hypothetical protein
MLPQHQIARPPRMAINEFRLRRVFLKVPQQDASRWGAMPTTRRVWAPI